MSKYIDLAEQIHAGTRDQVYLDEVGEVLDWLDDHPELTGRTITESELRRIAEDSAGPGASTVMPYIKATVEALSITIVPDPEPTNAERATADLETWGISRAGALELGPWLAGQGWTKAPGASES